MPRITGSSSSFESSSTNPSIKTTGPVVLKPFTPTVEQSDVINLVEWLGMHQRNPRGNFTLTAQNVTRIDGVPGCGKTATGVHAVVNLFRKAPDVRFKLVAFNTEAAAELRHRLHPFGLDRNVDTTHAFGRRRIVDALGGRQPELDRLKYYNVLQSIYPQAKKLPAEVKKSLISACDMARNLLLLAPQRDQKADLATLRILLEDKYPSGMDVLEASHLIVRMIGAGREIQTMIDYTDMLSLPIYAGIPAPELFDLIIVDEYQDNNEAQKTILQSSTYNLVVIGDQHQAIYGFRGAGSRNMEELMDWADTTNRTSFNLGLTYNFRSDVEIVKLAQLFVPHMKWTPGIENDPDRQGKIEYYLGMSEIITGCRFDIGNNRTVKILSRRNAPLVKYLIRLIKNNIPAYRFVGDEPDHLLAMLRASVQGTALFRTLDDVEVHIKRFFNDKIEKLTTKPGPKKARNAINNLKDCCECMLSLLAECDMVDDIQRFMEKLIPTEPNAAAVHLSTIHRAKGTEADTIYIVGTDYFGPNAAGYRSSPYWPLPPDEEDQEVNLVFVAITRAKKYLGFVGMPEILNPESDFYHGASMMCGVEDVTVDAAAQDTVSTENYDPFEAP